MYDINILPPKMRKKKKNIKIGNPTYAPFLLLGVLGASFFLNAQLDGKIADVKEEQEAVLRDIRQIEPDLTRVTSIVSEIEALRLELQMKNEVTNKSLAWDLLLDEIAASTPPEVTITSVEQGSSPNTVKIEAQTYTLTNMARMKESFIQNYHFESVDIPQFKHQNSTLLDRPVEVTFTLMAQYNPYAQPKPEEGDTIEGQMPTDPSMVSPDGNSGVPASNNGTTNPVDPNTPVSNDGATNSIDPNMQTQGGGTP